MPYTFDKDLVRWLPTASDKSTWAVLTIAYPHHEVHCGNSYYIEGYTTLADGGVFRVKLVTADSTKRMHLRWDISSSGILQTTLREGVSGGMTGGAAVTPLNSNRNSDNTSDAVLTAGVADLTNLGTLVSNAKWGAAGFKSTNGGSDARDDEIVLKQDTTYLRSFISSSDDNIIQFRASWYEHVDRIAL